MKQVFRNGKWEKRSGGSAGLDNTRWYRRCITEVVTADFFPVKLNCKTDEERKKTGRLYLGTISDE
jgi:hypothetical protein